MTRFLKNSVYSGLPLSLDRDSECSGQEVHSTLVDKHTVVQSPSTLSFFAIFNTRRMHTRGNFSTHFVCVCVQSFVKEVQPFRSFLDVKSAIWNSMHYTCVNGI